MTPPGLAGYVPPAGVPSDFTAARQLLADAGFPGGKGFPAIELLHSSSENLRVLAEALQETWRKELGLDVRLDRTFTFDLFEVTPYLEVLNAYYAKTPEQLVYDYRYRTKEPIGGLPILPMLGVKGEF